MRKEIAAYIAQHPNFTTTDLSLALRLSPSTVKNHLADMGFYLKRFQRGQECFDKWIPTPRRGIAA